MLEHHNAPTDATVSNPGYVSNESLSLVGLVQPPQKSDRPPQTRNDANPSPGTLAQNLTEMTVHDTDLNRAVDGYFAKADTDKNGFVDKNEVEQSKGNNDLTAKEQIIRSMLDSSLPSVQGESNDELGTENDGATRYDVTKAFDKWAKHNEKNIDLDTVSSFLPPIFNVLDADGNGFLTKEELDNPDTPGADFEERYKGGWAALTVFNDFENVQNATDDGLNESKGVSIGDVMKYAKQEKPGSGEEYMTILDNIYWPKNGHPKTKR